MSVRRPAWVECDGCGAVPVNEHGQLISAETVVEARKAAKSDGFVHLETEMLDLCPDCAKAKR